MNQRTKLPNRRAVENFTVEHVNLSGGISRYSASIGFTPQGRIGEVFLSNAKAASDLDVAARDAAIALSYAIQHGADLNEMARSMTRGEDERAQSPIGALLDRIIELQGGKPPG